MRTTLHAGAMLLAVLAVITAPALWSQEAGSMPRSCNIAGTWYGGGAEAKYLMTIIQDPGGDFVALGDGAFSQISFGLPVQTMYSGTIVKGSGRGYEFFSIGMVNNTTNFPAPTPEVWGVHSTVRMTDCNTLVFDYDFFGAYSWPTTKTPFLSQPDYVVVPPPFQETYHRMPTRCTVCSKH